MKLTPRELEIIPLVKKALTNKEIAAILNVTEKTIKFHLTNIYQKTETNRYRLILKDIKL